jgi:hypothetical protein
MCKAHKPRQLSTHACLKHTSNCLAVLNVHPGRLVARVRVENDETVLVRDVRVLVRRHAFDANKRRVRLRCEDVRGDARLTICW